MSGHEQDYVMFRDQLFAALATLAETEQCDEYAEEPARLLGVFDEYEQWIGQGLPSTGAYRFPSDPSGELRTFAARVDALAVTFAREGYTWWGINRVLVAVGLTPMGARSRFRFRVPSTVDLEVDAVSEDEARQILAAKTGHFHWVMVNGGDLRSATVVSVAPFDKPV